MSLLDQRVLIVTGLRFFSCCSSSKQGSNPILFVGNHQTFALDLTFLLSEVRQERISSCLLVLSFQSPSSSSSYLDCSSSAVYISSCYISSSLSLLLLSSPLLSSTSLAMLSPSCSGTTRERIPHARPCPSLSVPVRQNKTSFQGIGGEWNRAEQSRAEQSRAEQRGGEDRRRERRGEKRGETVEDL